MYGVGWDEEGCSAAVEVEARKWKWRWSWLAWEGEEMIDTGKVTGSPSSNNNE